MLNDLRASPLPAYSRSDFVSIGFDLSMLAAMSDSCRRPARTISRCSKLASASASASGWWVHDGKRTSAHTPTHYFVHQNQPIESRAPTGSFWSKNFGGNAVATLHFLYWPGGGQADHLLDHTHHEHMQQQGRRRTRQNTQAAVGSPAAHVMDWPRIALYGPDETKAKHINVCFEKYISWYLLLLLRNI